MCRAVWLAVVGLDDETCRLLRRSAGADAQVIALESSVDPVLALAAESLDAAVIDARVDGAETAATTLRGRGVAVVTVGGGGGEAITVALADVGDALEGAITRALIARGAR